jgi:hypothetical protein
VARQLFREIKTMIGVIETGNESCIAIMVLAPIGSREPLREVGQAKDSASEGYPVATTDAVSRPAPAASLPGSTAAQTTSRRKLLNSLHQA